MGMRDFGRIGAVGCGLTGSGTDVGEAAGASGPSIYKRFPSKSDLLVAAVVRGGEQRGPVPHRRSRTPPARARARTGCSGRASNSP
jgi:hypothetical protein